MKKKEIERISQKLISKPKLVWDAIDKREQKKIFDFDKGYQDFLNKAKTEREAVNVISDIALENGFSLNSPSTYPIRMIKTFQGKSIALSISGKKPISEGINLIVSHLERRRVFWVSIAPIYTKRSRRTGSRWAGISNRTPRGNHHETEH